MGTNSTDSKGSLGNGRLIFIAGLLLVAVVCLVFSWMTPDRQDTAPRARSGDGMAQVDLQPWRTAQSLAALNLTSAELEFAREAQRVADHEVDQAFASALRQAGMQRRVLTGEALALSRKLDQLQQTVAEDKARLQILSQAPLARGAASIAAADDLEIAKAQLALDSDRLADVQQDLARAGGDDRTRIQQELAAHEAAMHKYDAEANKGTPVAPASTEHYDNLAKCIKSWFDQGTRSQLVQQAMRQAEADGAAITVQHNLLEKASRNESRSPAAPERSAELTTLKNRTAYSQLLGIYDDRIQSQQQLAAVYRKWSAQLVAQRSVLLHSILQSFALIAVILICVILLDAFARNMMDRPTLDRRRMHTLRIISKLGIQFAGVLLILFVIFGAPNQMPTIIGLTTAGLTVVLQDFIIAFFGWFVLMGKNGIRIGDWVEINGVGGEVVEIGLFRTAMLETGNWTDKGHPTGRRVSFINSFAIKGQYFNFSTTGQWMWDEIRLTIPATDDTFAMIELIQKVVVKETEKDARLAEAEWKRATRRNGLSQFTAEPAVDMRPGASGIDIIVRYVTRAGDRFELRNRLYQSVIGLLHKTLTPRG